MPVQSLRQFSRRERRAWAPRLARTPMVDAAVRVRRRLALTVYGAQEMYRVVSSRRDHAAGMGAGRLVRAHFLLDRARLHLRASRLRLASCSRGRARPRRRALRERTAIVMPIYNEAPARVFAAMQAIFEDVEATGLGACLRLLLSSPTPPIPTSGSPRSGRFWRCASDLPRRASIYRRRRKNVSRKAGNIADFVTRWGGRYPHMVVLDADSLMTGRSDRRRSRRRWRPIPTPASFRACR